MTGPIPLFSELVKPGVLKVRLPAVTVCGAATWKASSLAMLVPRLGILSRARGLARSWPNRRAQSGNSI